MTTNKFIVERTVVGDTNTTVGATYTDVSGLSWYGNAGEVYKFKASVVYDVDATGSGANFSVSGPASPTVLSYKSTFGTAAGTEAANFGNAYDLPASAQTTGSAFTTDNLAIVEGVISPSVDGTITIRGIREASTTCTVQGTSSVLTWSRIDWPAQP